MLSCLLSTLAACSDAASPGIGASAGGSSGPGSAGGAGQSGTPLAAGSSGQGAGSAGASSTNAGGSSAVAGAAAAVEEGAGVSDGGAGAADASAAQAASRVRWVGRVDASDPLGPRFAWSGTGILARFSGTELGVRMSGAQQYTVLIDGVVQPKLITTGGVDRLASELAAGEHSVEIYRRTEASQGEAQFLGFELGDGELLEPPPAPERRIEIIGDSISCGYGNEGADETCSFTPDTENHYLSYGAIAARDVGADLVTVAWSGKGVVCNYGDEPTSCTEPMPFFYDRTLPARADSSWDFGQYQPQAVVINLGTNDMTTDIDPSEAEFIDAYVALLERVRAAYPEALILCTIGPLLNGEDLNDVRAYIDAAVEQRASAGDASVQSFELAPADPADGFGCDYHPSLITHELMAEALTSTLRAELGW